MGVSKNRGGPQIIHFNRVFHYKPSILGVPVFLETPISFFATVLPEVPFLRTASPISSRKMLTGYETRSETRFF